MDRMNIWYRLEVIGGGFWWENRSNLWDKMNVLEFKCELTCRGETENPEAKMRWPLAHRHEKIWD